MRLISEFMIGEELKPTQISSLSDEQKLQLEKLKEESFKVKDL